MTALSNHDEMAKLEILSSFINVDKLEKIVEFQEGETPDAKNS